MINLLPKEQRDTIMYARRNAKLLNLCIAMIVVIGVVVSMWGVGYFYVAKTSSEYNKTIAQKRTDLQAQNLEQTEGRIENFSNNLNLILQVLEKEVLFSKLLRQVGAVMPSGAILSNIEISEVQGGIDLSASAENYETATQVQVNLEDPANKLFEQVDIVSVSCSDDSEEEAADANNQTGTPGNQTETEPADDGSSIADQYPCTVNLRALFSEENPFLYINKSEND